MQTIQERKNTRIHEHVKNRVECMETILNELVKWSTQLGAKLKHMEKAKTLFFFFFLKTKKNYPRFAMFLMDSWKKKRHPLGPQRVGFRHRKSHLNWKHHWVSKRVGRGMVPTIETGLFVPRSLTLWGPTNSYRTTRWNLLMILRNRATKVLLLFILIGWEAQVFQKS